MAGNKKKSTGTSTLPGKPAETPTSSSSSASQTTAPVVVPKPVSKSPEQPPLPAPPNPNNVINLPRPIQRAQPTASTAVRINNTADASERAPLLLPSNASGNNTSRHGDSGDDAEPTWIESLNAIVRINWYTNWLLIFIPFGIASNQLGWGDTATFALNFLAIIPLAKLLDLATDQLSERVGQSLGALLNASFGNAVELIIGVLGLKEGLLDVVQSSIIGSILSNLLFVLGFCFLLGGIYHPTQKFNADIANVASSLLVMAIFGFILPAAFAGQLGNPTPADKAYHSIVMLSRGTAIFLLIAYVAYLLFQLVTHPQVFSDLESPPTSPRSLPRTVPQETEEEEEEGKVLSWIAAIGLLVGATLVIAICAEALVGSIEGLAEQCHLSRGFIGLIILPIVGNAAEHVTAVFAAMRNKMNLSLGVALGSSMQIALFLSPLLVIIGWIIGQDLTLNYTPFDTAVLFISILIVNHIVNDGESNWLEGFLLLMCYVIVAIAYYFLPDPTTSSHHLATGVTVGH